MAETIRQVLLRLLRGEAKSARVLSQTLGVPEKEILAHLSHIQRSLVHSRERLEVEPAECRSCGYVFHQRQRLTRPTRCPRCTATHLKAPRYRIIEAT